MIKIKSSFLSETVVAGARTLSGGLVQQAAGNVTYSPIQTTREAAAVAIEINAAAIPEPSSLLLSFAGLGFLSMRRKRNSGAFYSS